MSRDSLAKEHVELVLEVIKLLLPKSGNGLAAPNLGWKFDAINIKNV